ncbi:MAG: transglycosylase SLT domain-containing protein [Deltaproteobacteria bacterium]|nr:MAG: transglycosylase SLT domain-containing protein [Deltaproteobacteria bacterium]
MKWDPGSRKLDPMGEWRRWLGAASRPWRVALDGARRTARARRVGLAAAVAVVSQFAAGSVQVDETDRTLGIPAIVLERPGRALRAAIEARDAGEDERADAILAAVAARHPIIADHAERLRVRLWLDRDAPGRAIEIALQALPARRDSPLEGEFHALIGDASLRLGNESAARAEWELALPKTDSSARRVELSMAIAESFERSGDTAEAARIRRALWRDEPTASGAEQNERSLAELERALGGTLRTGADWLTRANALYRQQRSEPALEAYERALARRLPDADRSRAEHRRARCLFRLRRYPEAEEAFKKLGASGDAPLYRARSVARAGDVPKAVRMFEQLAARESGALADHARLLAGILLDGEGEPERARTFYESLIRHSRDADRVGAALWRVGWADYRAARYAEARSSWKLAALRIEDPIERLQPLYWSARAAERVGLDSGPAELEEIARSYPFTYYGLRARTRLGDAPPPAPEHPIPNGRSRLMPSDLERPRILLEAGLEPEAGLELDRLRRRARGLDDRVDLARLYTQVGEFHRAQSLIVDAYLEPLARGPTPGREELWYLAWPRAYEDYVVRALPGDALIEPELVYSIMREESGYRPEVESVVGARGLLQLMPSTAEKVAGQLSIGRIAPDDLFQPRLNIQLGTVYLNGLASRFAGRTSAAVGGYNAGPSAVAAWLAAGPELDDDEWVESIPYAQTRAYVKRVLRSLHVYREIY